MFAPVKTRRVFEEVVQQIREQITSGQLRPGDKLPPEREMAEQFSVSRNAVREALRVLEMAGTVQLHKGVQGGAYISSSDAAVISETLQDMLYLGRITAEQLTEARIWIESVVTRIVCETGTPEDFHKLEENVAEVRRLMKAGKHRQRVEANLQFHIVLTKATNNPVLILNMEMLMDIMRFFASQIDPGDGVEILESRERLMKHLWARDADKAVDEMTSLLKRVTKRYEKIAFHGNGAPAAELGKGA